MYVFMCTDARVCVFVFEYFSIDSNVFDKRLGLDKSKQILLY